MVIKLPNGESVSTEEAVVAVKNYQAGNYSAAFDLYDRPCSGPHDELLAIDILSLNALNVFRGRGPMTPMAALWEKRGEINKIIAGITKRKLELSTEAEIDDELPRLEEALEFIDSVHYCGETVASKLLHRLRPNIAPIWDVKVKKWYSRFERKTWVSRLKEVFKDVLENRNCLEMVRADTCLQELPILRIWDVLLWQLSPV
jgi:hypothetical protein